MEGVSRPVILIRSIDVMLVRVEVKRARSFSDASWCAPGDYGVDASLSAVDLRLPRLVSAPGDLLTAATTATDG